MEIITSSDNKTVKRFARLKQKKYRDEYGEFFVEGYRNALDTCAAHPDSVRAVLIAESKHSEICERFSAFPITVLSDALFDKISETESSQGVISVHAAPPSVFPSGRCVLLDRVRDPGNVGTVLRTAVALGYDVVANNCADVYSPKVTRSGMSAILKCNIGLDIPVSELKARGFEIIAADMRGQSVTSADPPRDKFCIVIGNEANGISEEIRALADRTVSVPQRGIESLNAAVAAGILMYALSMTQNI